ncbi:MAG: hypothetical protein ACFUZC_16220 [Chthoniobacteraceae bacterium]
MNSALTPGVHVASDEFDGSKVISQEPVVTANFLPETILGFDWNSRAPDKVFLTVGVSGINNIFGLAFNVDGETITAQTASMTTEYGRPWSTRRFSVSYREFETLATASLVKMKVSGGNSYQVTTLGSSVSAPVGTKLPEFLEQLRASR